MRLGRSGKKAEKEEDVYLKEEIYNSIDKIEKADQ